MYRLDSNWQGYTGNVWLGVRIPALIMIIAISININWQKLGQRIQACEQRANQLITNFTPERERQYNQMLKNKYQGAKQLGKNYTPDLYAKDGWELADLRCQVPGFYVDKIDNCIQNLHSLSASYYRIDEFNPAMLENYPKQSDITSEQVINAIWWCLRKYLEFMIFVAPAVILFKLLGYGYGSSNIRHELIGELIYNWKTITLAIIFWPFGLMFYPDCLNALIEEILRQKKRAEIQPADSIGYSYRRRSLTSAEEQRIENEVLAPIQAVEAWVEIVIGFFRIDQVSWKKPVISFRKLGAASFAIISGSVLILTGNLRIARADTLSLMNMLDPKSNQATHIYRYEIAGNGTLIGRLETDDHFSYSKLSVGARFPKRKFLLETSGVNQDGFQPRDVRFRWYEFGIPDNILLVEAKQGLQQQGASFLIWNDYSPVKAGRFQIGPSFFGIFPTRGRAQLSFGINGHCQINDRCSLYTYALVPLTNSTHPVLGADLFIPLTK